MMKKWSPGNVTVEKRDCLSHHEVLTRLDGYDPDRGVKIVGHRGYCLTGYGLFLNLALINYWPGVPLDEGLQAKPAPSVYAPGTNGEDCPIGAV